ncbi:MAG: hypothetical protein LIO79_06020 [Rikenellaceae bacterium]|nr:hypothetical protein [Rikenellaceae bacterium]
MNFQRLFFPILAGLCLTACTNSPDSEQELYPEGIPTYVSLHISLPGSINGSKALPEDYNEDGTYAGNDGIETL